MVETILTWATQPRPADGPRLVFATSVHGLTLAARDAGFGGLVNQAALAVPDGMPLLWFGRLRGHRGMERLRGTDLMRQTCAGSVGRGIRHYLYGGAPGVAERAAEALRQRYAGLAIAGCHAPPFRALSVEEQRADAARINQSGAEVVWVGLGTPKQERWAVEMGPSLSARVVITVGAAFDFLAGSSREAPAWIQRSGFEWLYRLAHAPRRLGRRYLVTVPVFALLAAGQLTGLVEFKEPRR